MNGDRADAEEAISRVAVRALQHLGNNVTDQQAWLRHIARNVCIDLHRERRKHSAESLDAMEDVDRSFAVVQRTTPEDVYIAREMRHSLWHAVDRLPRTLSRLMKLYYREEMLLDEVAHATGMSEANVRRKLGEAHRRVKTALRLGRRILEAPRADAVADEPDFVVDLPAAPVATRFVVVTTAAEERDVFIHLAAPPLRFSVRTLDRLDRYLAAHPRGWRKRLELARVLRQRGAIADSIPFYEQVVAALPSHALAWLELAESVAIIDGPAAAAERHAAAARAVCPEVAPLHDAMAMALGGHVAAAIDQITAMTDGSASAAYLWFVVAGIAAASGRIECAADAIDRALEHDPANSVLLTACYDIFRRVGRDDDAVVRLAAALRADPSNVLALQREVLRRASIPSQAQKHETAVMARRLEAISAHAADTVYALAELARARGSSKRVAALARALITRHPKKSMAWLRFAEIASSSGIAGSREIVAALRRAIDLDASNAAACVRLSAVLAEEGQDSDSLRVLESLAPRGAAADLAVVELLQCTARHALPIARAALRVLALNPSLPSAQQQLRCAYAIMNSGKTPTLR